MNINYNGLYVNNINNGYILKPLETIIKNTFFELIFSNECVFEFKINTNNSIIQIIHNNKSCFIKNEINKIFFSSKINKNDKIKIIIIPTIDTIINIKHINSYKIKQNIKFIIDKYFIINLKKDIERKELIINEMNKHNIENYEIIEAVNGKNIKIKDYNKKTIKSIGHYGCLLSHLKAIKKAKERKYNYICILEDDIQFINDYKNKIENLKIEKFDMLYLGGITNNIKLYFDEYSKINENNYVMGAYGYIVPLNFYDEIINILEKKLNCVDISYIDYIQSNKKNNILCLNDYVITNTETTNTSKKTDLFEKHLKLTKIKYNIIIN